MHRGPEVLKQRIALSIVEWAIIVVKLFLLKAPY